MVRKLLGWSSVKITKNYKILVLLGLNTVYFFVREVVGSSPNGLILFSLFLKLVPTISYQIFIFFTKWKNGLAVISHSFSYPWNPCFFREIAFRLRFIQKTIPCSVKDSFQILLYIFLQEKLAKSLKRVTSLLSGHFAIYQPTENLCDKVT